MVESLESPSLTGWRVLDYKMCANHLSKEQASELIDDVIDEIGAITPDQLAGMGGVIEARLIQKLTRLRDGYINVHATSVE